MVSWGISAVAVGMGDFAHLSGHFSWVDNINNFLLVRNCYLVCKLLAKFLVQKFNRIVAFNLSVNIFTNCRLPSHHCLHDHTSQYFLYSLLYRINIFLFFHIWNLLFVSARPTHLASDPILFLGQCDTFKWDYKCWLYPPLFTSCPSIGVSPVINISVYVIIKIKK